MVSAAVLPSSGHDVTLNPPGRTRRGACTLAALLATAAVAAVLGRGGNSPQEESVAVSPTGTNLGTWALESGGRVVTYDDEAWVEIHASDVG